MPKIKAPPSEAELEKLMDELVTSLRDASLFVDDPLMQAQDLAWEAWEARNPATRVRLAREALDISPLCADAWVILAMETAKTDEEAHDFYLRGVAAGKEALGADMFEEEVGDFWGIVETRPYMRARHRLAETLWKLGRHGEAIDHLNDMLRLNPNDNQGIRYRLAGFLMTLKRDAELEKLLADYPDDGGMGWLYTAALAAFRRGGETQESTTRLRKALEINPHIPAYLTQQRKLPRKRASYLEWGGEDEAQEYARDNTAIWT